MGSAKHAKLIDQFIRAMYHRYKQAHNTESTSIKSNIKKLDTLARLKECQARLQVAEQQLAQQVSKQYVEGDEDVHNNLLTIMNENAVDIDKALSNNSYLETTN